MTPTIATGAAGANGWSPSLLAALGGLLLGIATPPAPAAMLAWLWLPALVIWYALATGSARPLRHSYLFGCVHMAWFSWSVRHVLLPTYVGIVLVGGLYYLLATMGVRTTHRARPLRFAIAVAATAWLRAVMPEIGYPHGQPCHCLWATPRLLGSVTVGGESLANALLAGIAATAVDLWRSWRDAVPRWRQALTALGVALLLFLSATGLGIALHRGVGSAEDLRVAAIEPGFHPVLTFASVPRGEWQAHHRQLFDERVLAPTREVLRAAPPPELVLWPESAVAADFDAADIAAGRVRLAFEPWQVPGARLVVGATLTQGKGTTPGAFLVDPATGGVLAYQLKRRLVPGGEFLPLVRLLPAGLAASLHAWFASALGSQPDCLPGTEMPPLTTAAGVPFGALLCYDNAYPDPAAAQVAAGARLLTVLSNEAWFRGGGELTQLVAMSVCRALETATPIVRCTQDGWTVAVGADGRLLADLPVLASPQPAARILQVTVSLGSGRLPPLAWLRSASGLTMACLLGLWFLHGLVGWARLRVAPTATPSARDPGSSGAARGSGS